MAGRGRLTRVEDARVALRALKAAAALLALLAAPATVAAQTVILAFGDSITFGSFDDKRGEGKGYPARLEDLLNDAGRDVQVVNHGVAGETTAEGLSRIDSILPGGDFVLLMEGTNDIGQFLSTETIIDNLKEMARKAEARDVTPVYSTLIPRPGFATKDSDNIATGAVAVELRDLVVRQDRPLADPFEVFLSTPRIFRDFYATGFGDPVGHPHGEGYSLLAEVFFDVLQEIDSVPPVTGLVFPADGATEVRGRPEIAIDLYDPGSGVDVPATSLELNGDEVAAEIRQRGSGRVEIRYTPPQRLSGVVQMTVVTSDLAVPANSIERDVSRFTIQGTSFRRGDFDQSGRVDGVDLVTLALSFGSRVGDPRYFKSFDLVGDGVIDGEDLAVLSNNFGKS